MQYTATANIRLEREPSDKVPTRSKFCDHTPPTNRGKFGQIDFIIHIKLSTMVTIVAAHLRESDKGSFVSLQLAGPPEMVQSQNTGRFYMTCKHCFVSTTFGEDQARALIGTQFKGSIISVDCDEYSFTLPETGEVIQLAHRWQYSPEEAPAGLVALTA